MRCVKAGLWASLFLVGSGCGGQSTGSTPEPSDGPSESGTSGVASRVAGGAAGLAPTVPVPPAVVPAAPSCASGELDQKLHVSLKSASGATFLFTRDSRARCADGSEGPLTAWQEFGCSRLSLLFQARLGHGAWLPNLYVQGGQAELNEAAGKMFVGDIRYLASSSPSLGYLEGQFEIAPRDGSALWTGSFLARVEDVTGLVDPCRSLPLDGGTQ